MPDCGRTVASSLFPGRKGHALSWGAGAPTRGHKLQTSMTRGGSSSRQSKAAHLLSMGGAGWPVRAGDGVPFGASLSETAAPPWRAQPPWAAAPRYLRLRANPRAETVPGAGYNNLL